MAVNCWQTLILLKTVSSALAHNDSHFNILAFDGGGIKGIITATTIDQMELFAYKYATENNKNISLYTDEDGLNRERIPMKDLFDMMAGTSTGSLMATAFSIPSPTNASEPMFWGESMSQCYQDSAPKLFLSQGLNTFKTFVVYFSFFLAFFSLFYLCGHYKYHNPYVIR